MYTPRKLRKANRRLSGAGKQEKQKLMLAKARANKPFINLPASRCEGNLEYIAWCKRIDAANGARKTA